MRLGPLRTTGLFHLAHDHPVGTSHAVRRSGRRVPQNLNRFDVARVDAGKTPSRSRLDRDAIDHVQWLFRPPDRTTAANPHGERASRIPAHLNAGNPTSE